MAYECVVRRLDAQPALSVRCEAPVQQLGGVIPGAFRTVADYLRRSGVRPAGETFARYFRMERGKVEVEAGFTVRELVPSAAPPVEPSTLPAGETLVTLHRGPYERLPEAVAALQEWLRVHGRSAAGPFYEVYLNGPPAVTDPEQFQTEVRVPLEP